ncbi:MAG TPA: hypothetical protein VLX29_02265 [Nitrospirota bacterium]|nr:hypothetical protein [Nitrospirota bacterium]
MIPKDFASLVNLIVVSHLLHFLAVAFAIDLAYITLEPFRYTRRVRELFDSVDKEIKKIEQQLNTRLHDTALTLIATELSSLTTSGLGPCIGRKSGHLFKRRSMFGSKAQSGWDICGISILITILFILLVIAATHPEFFSPENYLHLPWISMSNYFFAVIIAFIGSLTPVVLIFTGNMIIRYKEKTIIKMLSSLKGVHGIDIDIDAFEKKLHEF